METNNSIVSSPGNALTQPAEKPAPPSWNEIGESFETIGKVGLAMSVGFAAAGLFCRLAQQGKVKVPSLSSLVLNSLAEPATTNRRPGQPPAEPT